jgi:hypothetical protein
MILYLNNMKFCFILLKKKFFFTKLKFLKGCQFLYKLEYIMNANLIMPEEVFPILLIIYIVNNLSHRVI